MPITREDMLKRAEVKPPIEVDIPGWGLVLLRHPNFAEWYALAQPARQHFADGTQPPADLIAKCAATVLSSPEGNRILSDAEVVKVMEKDFLPVMAVWQKAWATVLRFSEEDLEGVEKN
jgi:hypothetical protein